MGPTAPTPLADIAPTVASLHRTFVSGRTKPLAWRARQLRALHEFMEKHQDKIVLALQKDLHKSPAEALLEVVITMNETVTTLANLEEWSKPVRCAKNASTITDEVVVRNEPLGVVLIIGPWNFPFNLLIQPLISALGAGNCVVIKPSEISTATEELLTQFLTKILDPEAFKVVTGGVPETTLLLEQKFDHIFFTGSVPTGRIVMQAAAKHLTPVTLELGGKCPAYVDKDVNITYAANRLMWAKTINAGQVCLAPDYVLVHPAVKEKFVEACIKATRDMFTDTPENSSDYSRIITAAHVHRLQKLLNRQLALPHCKLEHGGKIDVDQRFVAPAIISGVRLEDPLMEDENFGPFLPIVEVKDEDEAIAIINSRPRALSIYVLSDNSAVAHKLMNSTSSGSVNINSFVFHLGVTDMPFGGIGNSGMGSYHGRAGFETFTHKRGMVWKQNNIITEAAHLLAYPPAASTPLALRLMTGVVTKSLRWAYFTSYVAKVFEWLPVKLAVIGVAFEAGRRLGWGGVRGVAWLLRGRRIRSVPRGARARRRRPREPRRERSVRAAGPLRALGACCGGPGACVCSPQRPTDPSRPVPSPPQHAFATLAAHAHDALLSSRLPPKVPSPSPFNAYTRAILRLPAVRVAASSAAVLDATQVFFEMLAASNLVPRSAAQSAVSADNQNKEWYPSNTVLAIEAAKLLCRIAILVSTSSRMLLAQAVPERDFDFASVGSQLTSQPSRNTANGTSDHAVPLISTSIGASAAVAGRSAVSEDDVVAFLNKKALSVSEAFRPIDLVSPGRGASLLAEWIHVLRPIIYLAALRKCGKKSWRPWILSLFLDSLSLGMHLKSLSINAAFAPKATPDQKTVAFKKTLEKEELSRRFWLLLYYLLRDPFYSLLVKERLAKFCDSMSKKPLISLASGLLSDYIPLWENYYFLVNP